MSIIVITPPVKPGGRAKMNEFATNAEALDYIEGLGDEGDVPADGEDTE